MRVVIDTGVLISAAIKAHTIPDCAMQVSRTTEVGDLTAYAPAKSCGCYFDFTTNGATSCKACTADKDCSGAVKHCNYGYCEAQ